MSDIFAEANKAKAKADERKAAKEILDKRKAEATARVKAAEAQRKFNDIPVFKPRFSI